MDTDAVESSSKVERAGLGIALCKAISIAQSTEKEKEDCLIDIINSQKTPSPPS